MATGHCHSWKTRQWVWYVLSMMAIGHDYSWQRCQWSEMLCQWSEAGDCPSWQRCRRSDKLWIWWQLVTAIHDEGVNSLVCSEWPVKGMAGLAQVVFWFWFWNRHKNGYVQCVIVNLFFSTNLIDFLHCWRWSLHYECGEISHLQASFFRSILHCF